MYIYPMSKMISRKKIKEIFILLFLMLFSFQSFADKLEKGFERLRIYDYFQAKECFEQSLEKKTPGAAYGLSVIYSMNNNPFYNLDSARHYILFGQKALYSLKQNDVLYYKSLGVTDSAMQALKGNICANAFKAACEVSTVEKLDTYIRNYSFCPEIKEAVTLRNSLAYKDSKSRNTSTAFKEFLETYQGALEREDAGRRYAERVYEETTADKNISSYEKYLKLYPESPYRNQAEKAIYTLSVPHKSIEEYHSFVKKYPSNKYVEEAWRELFKLYTKDYNEQVFLNFKKQFPDYPFKDELETDFALQQSFLLPFSKNNKWGFINEDGKEQVKPEYDEVSLFSEGLAAVEKNGKYGFINKSGKTIIPFVYDDAESFKNNAVIVSRNEKSGLINRNGEELIPIQYDDLSELNEGIYAAIDSDKTAYLTRTGKKLTEFMFDFTGDFRDGYSIAGINDKFGLLNGTCNYSIEPQFDELVFMSNGLLKAKQDDHWGIINLHGDVIASFVFDAIGDFTANRALVAKNRKCGFVDGSGKIVIPLSYPFSESLINTANFKNGYALLKKKVKSILLDSLGTKISLSGFEDIGLPSEGLVPVKKNKKWGFADLKGKIKILCNYNQVSPFENGYAKIKSNKLTGIIDVSGKTVFPAMYEDIAITTNYFICKSGGRSGLISKDGAIVLPAEYDHIEFLSAKIVSATTDNNMLYYSLQIEKVIWKEKE